MTLRLAGGLGRPSESGSFHGSEGIGGHCVVYDGDGGTTGMEHGALMGDGLVVLGASLWAVETEVVCPVRTVEMRGLWSMAAGCCSAGSW